MSDSEEFSKALSKAKIGLMAMPSNTFFSCVCMGLEHLVDTKIPTAETDGSRVFYNPDWFLSLTKEQRIGLVYHEIGHVIMEHAQRQKGRCPDRYNIAGDYAINILGHDNGFVFPPGGYLDEKFRDMTTEEIYDLLPPSLKITIELKDLRAPQGNAEAQARDKNNLDNLLVQAAIQAKRNGDRPGTIPGEVERYIESLLNPQLPWYRLLRNFMTKMGKTDYSFRRPNKKFFPDLIMPSMYSEKFCDPVVSLDLSGSISEEDHLRFATETYSILKSMKPDTITLIHWDTRITGIFEVHTLTDLMKAKSSSGGGTDIEEVLEWAVENNPAVMIIFTDGYFNLPDIRPKCPIIWVIYENPGWQAPFGRVIEFNHVEEP